MNYRRNLTVLALALLLLSGWQAVVAQEVVPGAILESTYAESFTVEAINAVVMNFYPVEQRLPAEYAVDIYHVRLQSSDEQGEPIPIFAQVFVPQVAEPAELPVFVFGAGSSGLVDACAPSREDPNVQNWGSYKAYLLSIATQGYLTILPDYAGFSDGDDETIQPYYVAEMAGRVLLDASRAVYTLFAPAAEYVDTPVTPADAVFLAGYSQGGQSIFAAKDLWQDYAPDVPLAGVVGYAPVTNMQSHMLYLPPLAPYRLYAWHDYYGDVVDLDAVFASFWLPTLEQDVLRLCVIDAAGYFSRSPEELYKPEFAASLRAGTLAEDYPDLNALFDLNNPGFVPNEVPALIIQGTLDTTIPVPIHEQFVEQYCAAGNILTEQLLEGVTHFDARQVSYQAVFDWMQAVAAGEPVPNDCAGE